MHTAIKNGHAANAETTAKKIKFCCLLLERLSNDNYTSTFMAKHRERWGVTNFNFDSGQLIITVEKAVTPKEKEAERKESSAIFRHAEKQRSQDLDLLFKTLRKHVEGWGVEN